MTTKMRVRDLSTELGVTNKELLHVLREKNIQVKSHMSGLTPEEVELVRSYYSEKGSEDSSRDKVTSSGVILRKKRRKSSKEASPSVSEQPDSTGQTAFSTSEAETADAAQEALEQEESEKPEYTPEAEESGPGYQDSSSLETEMPSEPDSTETAEKPEKEAPSRGKRKKKSRQKESPQVTVISKPEEKPEEQQQETEKEEELVPEDGFTEKAQAQPESPAESKQEKETPPKEAVPEEKKDKPEKSKKSSKKKGKDKRTVDVSNLYDEKEKSGGKKKKSDKRKDKSAEKQETPDAEGEFSESGASQPQHGGVAPTKAAKRKIKMEEAIRVSTLASEMGIKAQDIIKSLLKLGVMATINQSLDIDTATVVAEEYGFEVEKVGFSEEEFISPKKEDSPEELQPRPPVVTIMGHVDHGKTSLLDAIQRSKIINREAGGITQHIGAYHVQLDNGDIVFLDTPGHEAFTEMRSRGAQVTDIVILIVGADDGVMDQTLEAINHCKAANVPMIVAVNKIDKDNADSERVKRELADHGLLPEEWGGSTIFSYISAKQEMGLDQLLEMVLLQSEMMELQANPNKPARGHIIEARLDKGRGPVGSVLIQEGTLKAGDPFVCGLYHGKVRALFNDRGKKINTAGPAMPAEVQGFEGIPNAGDEYVVVENEKVAKRIAESRQSKQRERELAKETKVTLESFFAAKSEEEVKNLNLILKADVQGSLGAMTEAIKKLNTSAVKVQIIHEGTGAITESDIKLASASRAVIIGFNVRPTTKIRDIAEQEAVDIRFYNVIYRLVNDVKEAMAGMLEPITKEVFLGQAEVRDTFTIPKVGTIAGCIVVSGKLKRNAGIRLLRDGVVLYTGRLNSLKRFKDDAKEVYKDYECGAGLENYNDIKVGDIIEAYEEVQEKATL